ncbi:MAG: hypothetical protein IJ620_04125 [Bacteroidales bacterium]|nr:hypothetical protein [Bacteroidales bacterium]
MEPSEYKHVELSFIFPKYAHERFIERRYDLAARGKKTFTNSQMMEHHDNLFRRTCLGTLLDEVMTGQALHP